ncbi:MAG: ATP-binding protein [bacterium]|nr:ATP-binding protein [bacterium]
MPKAAGWVATYMRRLRVAGLRPRLTLIVLAAVVPALGLTLYADREHRRHIRALALAEAAGEAEEAAGRYRRIIDGTWSGLTLAAGARDVYGGDPAGCSRYLSQTLAWNPEYANLGVADADGAIRCSAVPLAGPVNASEHAWFRRAVRARGFALGNFQSGQVAATPVVVAALPVLDRAGGVVRVVFAGLNLKKLADWAVPARLPAGSVLLALDSSGTVLFRHPDHEKWVGRSIPHVEIARAMLAGSGKGAAEALGEDGVRRLYGIASVAGAEEAGALHFGVGIPTAVVLGPADRDLGRNLLLLGIVALLAMAVSWRVAASLVIRPVDALMAVARRLTEGDLSARTGLRHGEDEVGRLAHAFDGMAEGLQARQAELLGQQEYLGRLHEITRAALAAPDLRTMLQTLADRLVEVIGADACRVNLWDQTRRQPVLAAATGMDPHAVPWVQVEPGEATITGSALAAGRAIVVEDLLDTPYLSPRIAATIPFRSGLGVPLIAGGEKLGALAMFFNDRHHFTPDEIARAEQAGGVMALALQRALLLEQVRTHASELERRVVERTTELEAANADLEAFGYSVAHDLRAPLRAIQGFGQALREDHAGRLDEKGQDYLRRIESAAEGLDRMIQDLLAYSRLGRLEMRLQPVDLGEVVGEVLAEMEEEIRGQEAEVRVEDPLPVIRGHRTVLTQVLVNLISNALKFVEAGTAPRVRLAAEPRDGRVRLWVEDNGIGIAPEHQERIFRVFERLHGSEAYSGTGIGLAIVRRGVERMGGRVGVESAGGQGSRFWIELPEVKT